jgi:hypothetical protein
VSTGSVENMKDVSKTEEIRWQVLKAMLEQFPALKQKVKSYLKEQETAQ